MLDELFYLVYLMKHREKNHIEKYFVKKKMDKKKIKQLLKSKAAIPTRHDQYVIVLTYLD